MEDESNHAEEVQEHSNYIFHKREKVGLGNRIKVGSFKKGRRI